MGCASKERAGFTLVELVVVMAIIGTLAAVVMLNVNQVLQKSQITRIQADLKMLETAAYHYQAVVTKTEAEIVEVLEQEVLVGEGYLPKIIHSPIEGYGYRLCMDKVAKTVSVRLENAQGEVYQQGGFVADNQDPRCR